MQAWEYRLLTRVAAIHSMDTTCSGASSFAAQNLRVPGMNASRRQVREFASSRGGGTTAANCRALWHPIKLVQLQARVREALMCWEYPGEPLPPGVLELVNASAGGGSHAAVSLKRSRSSRGSFGGTRGCCCACVWACVDVFWRLALRHSALRHWHS